MEQSNKIEQNPQIHQTEFELVRQMIHNPDIVSETLLRLSPSDFLDDRARIVFKIIKDLVKKGQPITSLNIKDVFASDRDLVFENYESFLLDLTKYIGKSNYDNNINFIAKWSQERQLIALGHELCDPENKKKLADFDEFLEVYRKKFFDIITPKNIESVHSAKDITETWLDLFHKHRTGSTDVVGISTGYKLVDEYLGGFQRGDVYILAARPSRGKTTLALNFLLNTAEYCKEQNDGQVIFFSLEMTREEIFGKLVENIKGQSLRPRIYSQLSAHDAEEIEMIARDNVGELPIYIDDKGGISVSEIEQKIKRQLSIGDKIRFVVIDYLGLIKPTGGFNSGNIQSDVASISRDIKLIAKRLEIPILLLVQLNRTIEKRTQDKKVGTKDGLPVRIKPQLSDLRDSGAIEQDADVVMILTSKSDSENNGEIEMKPKSSEVVFCDILKNRKGPVGEISFDFHKSCSKFIERKVSSIESN